MLAERVEKCMRRQCMWRTNVIEVFDKLEGRMGLRLEWRVFGTRCYREVRQVRHGWAGWRCLVVARAGENSHVLDPYFVNDLPPFSEDYSDHWGLLAQWIGGFNRGSFSFDLCHTARNTPTLIFVRLETLHRVIFLRSSHDPTKTHLVTNWCEVIMCTALQRYILFKDQKKSTRARVRTASSLSFLLSFPEISDE